jgi:subtilisin family serine protease
MAGKSRLQKKNNINCNHDIPPVLMARRKSHRQLFLIIIIVIMESLQQANATDVIARMGDRRKTTSGTTSTTNYIVSFADMDVSPAKRCAALAKSMGGTVHQVYDHVLNGCSISTAVQAQSAFTALKNSLIVNFVAEDQVVSIDDQEVTESNNIFEDSTSRIHSSSSVAAATSWGLDRINQCAMPLDNEVTKQDASGVKVFIVDTGVYAAHEEFANGSIGPADCHFSAFAGENALSDGHGHG